MSKFKVGDKVIGNSYACKQYSTTIEGWSGTVECIKGDTEIRVSGFNVDPKYFELVEESIIINKINMNILEKFKLSLKGEPQKSYQKAGITDSSDVLTKDGEIIFLSYLLSKNPEFKTEVVDGLLADIEKNK